MLLFVGMLRSSWPLFGFTSLLVLAICALTISFRPFRDAYTPATINDIDQHSYRIFGDDTKATVLFFVTDGCPITNSYMPEMNRIVATYTPQKVAFFAVYTDPSVPVSAIRQHAKAFDLHIPLVSDNAHLMVRRAGSTVTPEAAVFAPGGHLAYLGRIDDWYLDLGERRAAPTHGYLRQALDEVLKGQTVAIAQVPPVGCSIAP